MRRGLTYPKNTQPQRAFIQFGNIVVLGWRYNRDKALNVTHVTPNYQALQT
jgi:hypothetical protein